MSDTQKWTPEPWRAEWQPGQTPKHTYTHCVMAGDDSLCDTLTKADAYRIVACVNAMAGIADPAEYRKNADAAIRAIEDSDDAMTLRNRIAAITRERDALREQVKVLRDEVRAWRGHAQEIVHIQHTSKCNTEPDPDCMVCKSARKHRIMACRAATDAAGVEVKP